MIYYLFLYHLKQGSFYGRTNFIFFLILTLHLNFSFINLSLYNKDNSLSLLLLLQYVKYIIFERRPIEDGKMDHSARYI